jgi:hypothetical protein
LVSYFVLYNTKYEGRSIVLERIQRKRVKGWKMPANTISVCRPGKFGNPYVVGKDGTAGQCAEKFRLHLNELLDSQALEELRGKNLACWCKIGQPCHADVLLESS